MIRGIDRLEGRPTVLADDERGLVLLDAVDEILHLLREAVVPELLEGGEGPAGGQPRLLDRVPVTGLGVGSERAAANEVGAGVPHRAVDLGLVVHAAALGP